jgi:hypothetical protein
MAKFFKLINITSSLPKRHPKKNMTLDIKYGDGFKSATKKLPAGGEMFIICERLPMNIQKLNLEKLIVVNRVTENEYKRTQRKISTPKPVKSSIVVKKEVVNEVDVVEEPIVTVVEEKVEEKPKRQYRRKSSSKKEEDSDE